MVAKVTNCSISYLDATGTLLATEMPQRPLQLAVPNEEAVSHEELFKVWVRSVCTVHHVGTG